MDANDIVRVISVVDTREYVEDGDRFVPVPGSGDLNECVRCGRSHEVHATVELGDGNRAIVGTGCMNFAGLDVVKDLKSGANRAKRVASLNAQLASLKARKAAWEAASVKVQSLPVPEVVVSPKESKYLPGEMFEAVCGDCAVTFIDRPSPDWDRLLGRDYNRKPAIESARRHWLDKRTEESAGCKAVSDCLIRDTERKLAKLDA